MRSRMTAFLAFLSRCRLWLWATPGAKRSTHGPLDKTVLSMRTTANCRYEASVRLRNYSRFNFVTSIVLSLGLVLVPLMEKSGVTLHVAEGVRWALQVFLAVAVLAYSIVIGMARFDVRAIQAEACAASIKELVREIERTAATTGSPTDQQMADYERRYQTILADVENHTRNDYRNAVIGMSTDYPSTGLPWLVRRLHTWLVSLLLYSIPLALMGLVIVFILEMHGVTQWIPQTSRLNASSVTTPSSPPGAR